MLQVPWPRLVVCTMRPVARARSVRLNGRPSDYVLVSRHGTPPRMYSG
jgi:hypothetical protein